MAFAIVHCAKYFKAQLALLQPTCTTTILFNAFTKTSLLNVISTNPAPCTGEKMCIKSSLFLLCIPFFKWIKSL